MDCEFKATFCLSAGSAAGVSFPAGSCWCGRGCSCAGAQSQSSATNPFFGSVTAQPTSDETLKLSLDDAIRRGLENNLGLKEAENNEKTIQGEKNEALQEFLPTITLSGDTGVHQQNLAALGFGPSALKDFARSFPAACPAGLSFITRDDLTEGQDPLQPDAFLRPGDRRHTRPPAQAREPPISPKCRRAARWCSRWPRPIFTPLPPPAKWTTPRLLKPPTNCCFDQAHAAHQAGTAANLDELRARVQLQAQQQALIAAQNALEKDLILLKREIGIDPGQKIVLTDPAPYSELAAQTP